MSTKTNFKRIALVAVAALGLGVLSSVPSQANITGVVTVTAVNGSATTSLVDSTTAGTLSVRWLAGAINDSVAISVALNSKPTLATTLPSLSFLLADTATSNVATTTFPALGRTATAVTTAKQDTASVISAGGPGYTAAKFYAQLDTTVVVAGTYTYTVSVTPWGTAVETTKVVTAEFSVVVTAPASSSTVAASTYSTAYIGTSVDSSTAVDVAVAASGKSSVTQAATVFVRLLNASGTGSTLTKDSLTVSVDKGNVSGTSGAPLGRSIIVNYAPTDSAVGGVPVYVFPDGSTGTATVTIKTLNAGTFTKTLTFVGTTTASIVATLNKTVIGVGAETANSSASIKAAQFDANSTNFGSLTDLYAYSSDTSVISSYGSACSVAYTASAAAVYCPLTGVKAGTATITVRDASTVALSTVVSNGVSVRVSQGVASSFTITTDKASYAPGEKGYVIVTVKDAAGLVMPSGSFSLASGGISTTVNLGNSSDTLTGTAITTNRASTPSSTDPIAYYTFYAPVTAGSFTFSAKGGSAFSAASQATATTVTATVADSASAALAAVSALAVTVASLKTLITTLTNLVLKIQKKVKA